MNFVPTMSSAEHETESGYAAERVSALVDAITDTAILLGTALAIIALCVVSAIGADYLWTILGRMGLSSPLSPWFAILAAMLVDVWLAVTVLNRLVKGHWWWRPRTPRPD